MGRERLTDDMQRTYDAAVALGESPELFRALVELSRDEGMFAKAAGSGGDMLRDFGVEVPDGLSVQLTRTHEGMPYPGEGWYPYTVVLSNCRKFYKLNQKKVPPVVEETEAVCFTFVIVPTPIPGGPRG